MVVEISKGVSSIILTTDERNLKRAVQTLLLENGVLGSRTEREWNAFCTRRVLQNFVALYRNRKQQEKKREQPAIQQRKEKGIRPPHPRNRKDQSQARKS